MMKKHYGARGLDRISPRAASATRYRFSILSASSSGSPDGHIQLTSRASQSVFVVLLDTSLSALPGHVPGLTP